MEDKIALVGFRTDEISTWMKPSLSYQKRSFPSFRKTIPTPCQIAQKTKQLQIVHPSYQSTP